jgi:hypothetical protein
MQDIRRVLRLGLMAAFALGACNSDATNPTGNDAGAVCGTQANPGILTVTGRSPALGATVVNQGIVHRFVVENAPAIFVNFTLDYDANHTAGLSAPTDPKLEYTPSGSTIIYELTVDAWSNAPGHVELKASSGYETSKHCSWEFPSPLFSYDITPASVFDGGAAEARSAGDGGGSSVDSSYDVPGVMDAASAIDAPAETDVPLAFDGLATVDAPAQPDGGVAAVDAAPFADVGVD